MAAMIVTEALATLVILVTLMGFIYTLHRGTERRLEALDRKFEARFDALSARVDALEHKFERKFDAVHERIDALERKFERKFDAVNERIDTLLRPHIELVRR